MKSKIKKEVLSKREKSLFYDVCNIIDGARSRVAVYVNSEICMVRWHVGKRIKDYVLYNQRAEYGKQVVRNLSKKLTEKYGKGWGYESLKHCLRCAEVFTEDEIGYAMRIQFTWTHIRTLCSISDTLERQFYMEMCRIEHWDTRTLSAKIDSQLFERTAISQKPEEQIRHELSQLKEENILQPDFVFRSSYFTQLPDKRLLAEKLQRAIAIAKEHLAEKILKN